MPNGRLYKRKSKTGEELGDEKTRANARAGGWRLFPHVFHRNYQ